MSCTAPSECTAVGNREIYKSPSILAFAETWDGTGWTLQHMPPLRGGFELIFMQSVSCTGRRACTAVGSNVTKAFAEAE